MRKAVREPRFQGWFSDLEAMMIEGVLDGSAVMPNMIGSCNEQEVLDMRLTCL